eukprot:Nk52_evm6s216 gene=Nk52_evmTU6s216
MTPVSEVSTVQRWPEPAISTPTNSHHEEEKEGGAEEDKKEEEEEEEDKKEEEEEKEVDDEKELPPPPASATAVLRFSKLESLPVDVLLYIVGFLSNYDVFQLVKVNHFWYKLCIKTPSVWVHRYVSDSRYRSYDYNRPVPNRKLTKAKFKAGGGSLEALQRLFHHKCRRILQMDAVNQYELKADVLKSHVDYDVEVKRKYGYYREYHMFHVCAVKQFHDWAHVQNPPLCLCAIRERRRELKQKRCEEERKLRDEMTQHAQKQLDKYVREEIKRVSDGKLTLAEDWKIKEWRDPGYTWNSINERVHTLCGTLLALDDVVYFPREKQLKTWKKAVKRRNKMKEEEVAAREEKWQKGASVMIEAFMVLMKEREEYEEKQCELKKEEEKRRKEEEKRRKEQEEMYKERRRKEAEEMKEREEARREKEAKILKKQQEQERKRRETKKRQREKRKEKQKQKETEAKALKEKKEEELRKLKDAWSAEAEARKRRLFELEDRGMFVLRVPVQEHFGCEQQVESTTQGNALCEISNIMTRPGSEPKNKKPKMIPNYNRAVANMTIAELKEQRDALKNHRDETFDSMIDKLIKKEKANRLSLNGS